jgi:hypothetical protein
MLKNEVLRFEGREAHGWAITAGPCRFLVLEGSGYSRPLGREIYRYLNPKKTIYPKRRPLTSDLQ